MENSISLEELKTHIDDREAHILYLLRVGAFKSMAAMARDMGVTDGWIRQIKHRRVYKQPSAMYCSNYVERMLQIWCPGKMPMENFVRDGI